MPPRVFCLKRTVVYPVIHAERPQIDDKMRSVVLQPNEQLNVIEKTEVYTVLHSSKVSIARRVAYRTYVLQTALDKWLVTDQQLLKHKGKYNNHCFISQLEIFNQGRVSLQTLERMYKTSILFSILKSTTVYAGLSNANVQFRGLKHAVCKCFMRPTLKFWISYTYLCTNRIL